jgi:hypothetical protein
MRQATPSRRNKCREREVNLRTTTTTTFFEHDEGDEEKKPAAKATTTAALDTTVNDPGNTF